MSGTASLLETFLPLCVCVCSVMHHSEFTSTLWWFHVVIWRLCVIWCYFTISSCVSLMMQATFCFVRALLVLWWFSQIVLICCCFCFWVSCRLSRLKGSSLLLNLPQTSPSPGTKNKNKNFKKSRILFKKKALLVLFSVSKLRLWRRSIFLTRFKVSDINLGYVYLLPTF